MFTETVSHFINDLIPVTSLYKTFKGVAQLVWHFIIRLKQLIILFLA